MPHVDTQQNSFSAFYLPAWGLQEDTIFQRVDSKTLKAEGEIMPYNQEINGRSTAQHHLRYINFLAESSRNGSDDDGRLLFNSKCNTNLSRTFLEQSLWTTTSTTRQLIQVQRWCWSYLRISSKTTSIELACLRPLSMWRSWKCGANQVTINTSKHDFFSYTDGQPLDELLAAVADERKRRIPTWEIGSLRGKLSTHLSLLPDLSFRGLTQVLTTMMGCSKQSKRRHVSMCQHHLAAEWQSTISSMQLASFNSLFRLAQPRLHQFTSGLLHTTVHKSPACLPQHMPNRPNTLCLRTTFTKKYTTCFFFLGCKVWSSTQA